MVLGQPWLFSHSTRIDYIHDMGVALQLGENGDRKGPSGFINLPLIKAPRNVMPISLCHDYESYGTERTDGAESVLTSPRVNPKSNEVLELERHVVKGIQLPGLK